MNDFLIVYILLPVNVWAADGFFNSCTFCYQLKFELWRDFGCYHFCCCDKVPTITKFWAANGFLETLRFKTESNGSLTDLKYRG